MFSLTPTEQRVIIVLILLIGGAGIVRLIKPMTVRTEFYDYRQSDSIFAGRSGSFSVQNNNAGSLSIGQENPPAGRTVFNQKEKDLPAAGSVDLNRATVADLELLPRVGPAMARRIVAFRSSNGKFKSLQELKKIKGIGDKTFAVIRPYLKDLK